MQVAQLVQLLPRLRVLPCLKRAPPPPAERAEGPDPGTGVRGGDGGDRTAPLPLGYPRSPRRGARRAVGRGGARPRGAAPPPDPPPPTPPPLSPSPGVRTWGRDPGRAPGSLRCLSRLFKIFFAANGEAAAVSRLMPGWWQAPRIVCCLTGHAISWGLRGGICPSSLPEHALTTFKG